MHCHMLLVSIEEAYLRYIAVDPELPRRHGPSFCPSAGPHVEEPSVLSVQLVAGMA